MFAKPLGALAAATLALSFAGAVHAAVIFTTGPSIGGGLEDTEARVADDFTFATDTKVGGAGVFMDGRIGAWDGGFQYQVYSDVADQPGLVLTEGDVIVHPVDTGVIVDDTQHLFLFQFDFLTPFQAQAGQTYFLAVHARSDFRDNDGIFWTFANPDSSLGVQFQENGQGDFIALGDHGNMAFFLTSAGAPEPAGWALMLGGFGLAGAGLRARRRRVATATL